MHLQPNRNQNQKQIRKPHGKRAEIAGGGSGPSGAVIIIVSLAFCSWVGIIHLSKTPLHLQPARQKEMGSLRPLAGSVFLTIFFLFFTKAGKTHHHHNVPSISGNSVCCGHIPLLKL